MTTTNPSSPADEWRQERIARLMMALNLEISSDPEVECVPQYSGAGQPPSYSPVRSSPPSYSSDEDRGSSSPLVFAACSEVSSTAATLSHEQSTDGHAQPVAEAHLFRAHTCRVTKRGGGVIKALYIIGGFTSLVPALGDIVSARITSFDIDDPEPMRFTGTVVGFSTWPDFSHCVVIDVVNSRGVARPVIIPRALLVRGDGRRPLAPALTAAPAVWTPSSGSDPSCSTEQDSDIERHPSIEGYHPEAVFPDPALDPFANLSRESHIPQPYGIVICSRCSRGQKRQEAKVVLRKGPHFLKWVCRDDNSCQQRWGWSWFWRWIPHGKA
ncbi:hypothetical protein H0H93_009898 [Arthromyces matolae]|nr:hypothetical protein H0H93_009898 [Arthromyces matolae]